MKFITLYDLAKTTGISKSLIYHYVKSGLLPHPTHKTRKVLGGLVSIYSINSVETIKNIRKLTKQGRSLKEIKSLSKKVCDTLN